MTIDDCMPISTDNVIASWRDFDYSKSDTMMKNNIVDQSRSQSQTREQNDARGG